MELSGNDTTTPIAQSPTPPAIALLTASANLSTPNAANGEIILASFLANAAFTTPAGFSALESFSTGSNGGENYGVYFNSSAQASTSITSGGLGLGWGTIALELNHA